MTDQKIEINRTMVGIITVGCFIAAGVIWWLDLEKGNRLWQAGFIRVGLLMGAFWFALPTKYREAAWANVSPWTFVGILLAVLLLPRYPRVILPAIVVLSILGWFLRPKKRAPATRSVRATASSREPQSPPS